MYTQLLKHVYTRCIKLLNNLKQEGNEREKNEKGIYRVYVQFCGRLIVLKILLVCVRGIIYAWLRTVCGSTHTLRSRVLSPLSTCWTQASCRQRTMRPVPVFGRSWMHGQQWRQRHSVWMFHHAGVYRRAILSLWQAEFWWWCSDTNSLAARSSSQVLNHCHTDSLTVGAPPPQWTPLLPGGQFPPAGCHCWKAKSY